jgi:hypothetical protein
MLYSTIIIIVIEKLESQGFQELLRTSSMKITIKKTNKLRGP